jgi:predicted metalloprotease with PDZ domain
MKKIISSINVLLLIVFLPAFSFSSEPSKAITYSFSFKEISNNKLLVKCTFQGSRTGITELILPYQWANQLELYKNIDKLNCVEHTIENTDQSHIKIIHHNANELITINYVIQLLSENINHENYYRPIGDHSYFYAIGHGMFVIPSAQDSKMTITLKWNDIPKDWKVANSFGQEQVLQEIIGFPNDLQSGAFLAGDFQIIKCSPGTNPVYVAIRGNWPFSADELTALVEQIFISQRNFWNDHEFPYYLVSVVPIDAKNSTGGTALRDTFSLFLGDNNFSKDDYLKHLGCLISHEHFHTWNGHKIRSSEPEGSMYWFSEGFTEYYAVKLNRKSGIMSQKEYVDHVNDILMHYFSSPVHNASNETIVKNFWTDPATEKLPYDRGFALALYLDTKIQSKSEKLSLDNFMYDLLELTNQKGVWFSFDDLFNLVANYVDQQDLPSIKRFVIEGESIPIFHHAMGSDYHLEWEDYIGFKLRESLAQGSIKGVSYGNIAFQAGLKNGLKILEFNRSGSIITLTVMDEKEGIQKDVSYDLKEIKQIPQYVIKLFEKQE